MKPRVLVTRHVYPEAIDLLKAAAEVDYIDTYDGLPPAELLERAKGKNALVTQLTDKMNAGWLAALDGGVRVIANVAVGYDNIHIPAATARRIVVTNTPDVLTDTTADFAFALLMSAARRVVEGHAFVHSGEWKSWRIDMLVGQDIHHKTLGIFGMGRIGQAMARRGSGFSMRILYHDAVRAPEPVEKALALEFVSKDELLAQSDFVSMHVPLLAETKHLIGKPELERMKQTAILVNTARGPVVDESALIDALEQGVIAGAGLDVFENEPAVPPRMLALKNVALAPHIASASVDTRKRMCTMAAENALAVLSGRRPANPVNPEVLG
jgi:lactate dehydrogenase-like 2-hydroxyacid dehydrogenase